ncbi:hypothetical protein LO763_11635 [Glycomyces sp. A-F 0318]|uniref:hypothetical protein n=1 Tax=Glycomyces amatae TaxID=2881355 RepID=UPI001E4D1F77|nr:hypothetical protein [Glycomyces amatae]MCD0444273.1 hypothetical protein [Glycomyces amatae]
MNESLARPQVAIGEFWLTGLGLFKAYLPEDPSKPHQADLESVRVTFAQMHPEVRDRVAAVTGLDPDAAEWESWPDGWPETAKAVALAKAGQLRRAARLRAGLGA